MRSKCTNDHLGHLVPPGRVRRPHLEHGLTTAMRRLRTNRTVPTRYVVSMHPSDLAWLDPYLPELLARSLARTLAKPREITVEFEPDADLEPGRPRFWAGFAGDDLLVLSNADVKADVTPRVHVPAL